VVNWEVFKSNMTSYLSSYMAQDTKSFVNFFLTQFDLALRTGQNINGNLIIKTNFEFALTTTLAAMELQMQLNNTFIEVQQNIDIIVDFIIENELTKLLNLPNTPKTKPPSNPLISQAISLGSSFVTPILKNIVGSLISNENTETIYKLSKQKIDKESIKEQINNKLNPLDKTFDIIANGISLTLMNSGLLPIPPIPPTLIPNYSFPYPCIVLFPGDVINLKKDLKRALSDNALIKTPQLATQLLQLALQKYLMTIGGLYFGMLYVGTAIIPAPPIPWIGIT
jgi:hypothetical protein